MEYMVKDTSLTFPEDSPLLAEYLLNDNPVRVQIMKNKIMLPCLAPPTNKIGRCKISFFVDVHSNDRESVMSAHKSPKGSVKVIQCSKRHILMHFPGARRLTCRKRLRASTAFLKEHGVSDKEFCICIYVVGSELPEKMDFMVKDTSVTFPEGSLLLAEYLLNDNPVRVQIMKNKINLPCLAPPTNKIGRCKTSFVVDVHSNDKESIMSAPKSS